MVLNMSNITKNGEMLLHFLSAFIDDVIEDKIQKVIAAKPSLTSKKMNLRHAKVDDIFGLNIKFLSLNSCKEIIQLVKDGEFDKYGMNALGFAHLVGPAKVKKLKEYFYYE